MSARPATGCRANTTKGLNIFMLSYAGFDSPWWFTPRQVNDLDGHIIKGERVSWISFFKPWLPKGERSEAPPVDADAAEESSRRRPVIIVRSLPRREPGPVYRPRHRRGSATSTRTTGRRKTTTTPSPAASRSSPACPTRRPSGTAATGPATGRPTTRSACRNVRRSCHRKRTTPRYLSRIVSFNRSSRPT